MTLATPYYIHFYDKACYLSKSKQLQTSIGRYSYNVLKLKLTLPDYVLTLKEPFPLLRDKRNKTKNRTYILH